MQNNYKYTIQNPDLESLGYLVAIANTQDKHDRSAPTHYHWKILKCRMMIFSNSSILACPDKQDIKRVHIVFSKRGDDYDKIISLFLKFSLGQDGAIRPVTSEVFQMCFSYTLTAKLAPAWNILGYEYLINNRDFLTTKGPQDGIKYQIWTNDNATILEVKPIKINVSSSDDIFLPGEWIRVLPRVTSAVHCRTGFELFKFKILGGTELLWTSVSLNISLNKAVVEEYCESMPESGSFRCYKDLRRHWKNIHGYRLPEAESPYYSIRFWRGDPLTYPRICILRSFPVVTPVNKQQERVILSKFLSSLKSRFPNFLGAPLMVQYTDGHVAQKDSAAITETQAISLCTPTQNH